jgi:hypothetical protein
MEDHVVTLVAEVCQASQSVKTAIATLLNIEGSATLQDRELVAAITQSLQKLASTDAVFKTVEKLLQSTPRQTQPTTMTVRSDLKLSFKSFTTMSRQIEGAQQKGYTEREIKDAVANALSLGRPIKHYLETANLTLEETTKMLQHHFKEPSATELFTSLTKAVQKSDESATDFLMRVMDIRERTRIAAKNSEEHKYPDSLINTMFQHALSTGLIDVEMRLGLQELMEKNASDEKLFEAVSKLASRTQERQSKRCLKLEASADERPERKADTGLSGDVVDELKARINVLESQLKQRERPARNRFQCDDCKRRQERRCSHCWSCGSATHFSRDCKSKPDSKQSGNGNRSR